MKNIDAGTARRSLTGILLCVLAQDLATENITQTTYYPAPSGVYSQMITTSNTYLARDAGGRVGIGTTDPSASLEVSDAIRFAAAQGELSPINGNPSIGSSGNYPFLFAINGAEQARITETGNLGLGTSAPATKLEVDGSLSFTSPGSGYAKICQDVAYVGGGVDPCPPNSMPVMAAGTTKWYAHVYTDTTASGSVCFGYPCTGPPYAQPTGFPSEGTIRCCKISP